MTFLTATAAIWLFASIFFMIYCIGRDIYHFVKKRNKRKDLHYLRHCSKPQDGPGAIIGGEWKDLPTSPSGLDLSLRIAELKADNENKSRLIARVREAYHKSNDENDSLHNQNANLKAENENLIYQNKDLQNGIEALKEDKYNIIRDLKFEKVSAQVRIKELEAALARAEGLNRTIKTIEVEENTDLQVGDTILYQTLEGELAAVRIDEVRESDIKTSVGGFSLCNRGRTWAKLSERVRVSPWTINSKDIRL